MKQAYCAGCAQNLPDATQLFGKIHLFSKIIVTFEPSVQALEYPKTLYHSAYYDWKLHF